MRPLPNRFPVVALATLLTLLVVPCLYVILYRLAAHFGWGGLHKAGQLKPVTAELEDF